MNLGNVTDIASKAGNEVVGSNALKTQSIPTNNSNITQFPTNNNKTPQEAPSNSNVIQFPGNDKPAQTMDKPADVKEFPGNNEDNEGPKPGDKAGSGKQYNEKGEVEDSSTKKTLKAVGRGAAAYATGGQSLGYDREVTKLGIVDNTLDKASDTLDKVPGMEQVTKELDDAGIVDGANDIMDAAGSIKNGDIGGAIESGEKILKDTSKMQKYTTKKMMPLIIGAAAGFLFFIVIFAVILSPVLGGYMDIVEGINKIVDSVKGVVNNVTGTVADFIFSENELEKTYDIVNEIPNYNNLSTSRQKTLAAAAQAVAIGVPYGWGSHATSTGIEGISTSGLDCSAFVEWAIWTGTGSYPGYLTTSSISSRIGTDFIEIDKSELQPGDIGLKKLGGSTDDNVNHTGIYAGNNQWFHETGGSTKKAVRNNYSGFTIYLRYTGLD